MMSKTIITNNLEETQKLGEHLARNLSSNVIALYGDLGTGKTTFVQGVAKGLGIKNKIISPTFIIMRAYEIKSNNQKIKCFYHLDLYRIENKKDLEELGIEEIMNDPQNVVVVEWAEKIKETLPKERIDIYFEYIDEKKRKITLIKN